MHIIATSTMVIADVHGRGHVGGWGGGRMWLWGTLMVLFWVAIIAGVVWLVSRGRTGTAGTTSSRARDILDERYAQGELSTEEYLERLEQLS